MKGGLSFKSKPDPEGNKLARLQGIPKPIFDNISSSKHSNHSFEFFIAAPNYSQGITPQIIPTLKVSVKLQTLLATSKSSTDSAKSRSLFGHRVTHSLRSLVHEMVHAFLNLFSCDCSSEKLQVLGKTATVLLSAM
jgi:hypothetical protein